MLENGKKIEDVFEVFEKRGYDIKNIFINSTRFADDFGIISRNKTHHQKLIDDIEHNVTSVRLRLKPSKCRSLTISSRRA